MDMVFHPIGYISSPYKTLAEVPRGGWADKETEAEIVLDEKYVEGAADIKPGEQYMLIFCFHKSEGYSLTVHAGGDGPLRGVFSTHSPHRPNHIGVSFITVTKISGNRISFTGVDMLDGTPVLDIKSY